VRATALLESRARPGSVADVEIVFVETLRDGCAFESCKGLDSKIDEGDPDNPLNILR
jgi:hypothetical protein